MEKEETQQIELPDLEIEEILSFIIGLTSSKAIQYLGIPLKPDQESEKDLIRARVAIDTTSLLVDKLEPYINEEELKQLKQMVTNLQLSYVRES
ncbi:DUF1844 domain-containing protein [Thermoproteota archaeon]